MVSRLTELPQSQWFQLALLEESESLEALWAVHDLANRLDDAEARAARAEAQLEMLKRDTPPKGSYLLGT